MFEVSGGGPYMVPLPPSDEGGRDRPLVKKVMVAKFEGRGPIRFC